ncbi:MAG: NAD(P)-dependent oxidoreductase [Bacteroidota bacterium]
MKILIASKTHEYLLDALQNAGHDCELHLLKDSAELALIIANYEGVVINSRFVIDKKIVDLGGRLRFVARVGAGMESIDTVYLDEKGIRWFNSPEGNRQAVGEHCLGLLLSVLNHLHTADREVRSGEWRREANRGRELSGKTVGIIGYGNMGSAFARCLSGFDVEVIGYDKYKFGYSDDWVREKSLMDLWEQADIVSLHVPWTVETHYMVNEAFINSFRKNIFLLNTARGKVVKTVDLVASLISGKVMGAGLDVLEFESDSFEKMCFEAPPEALRYLMEARNVMLTPHIAGWTGEADLKHARVLAEKIVGAF